MDQRYAGQGVIRQQGDTPRSYLVDTPGGGELRRNRRHLVRTNPEENGENEHSETENVQQNESLSCHTTERNDGSEMILEQRPIREHKLPSHLKDFVISK